MNKIHKIFNHRLRQKKIVDYKPENCKADEGEGEDDESKQLHWK